MAAPLGADGTRVNYSPGGQAVLDQWGSLRYAANTAFVALVYADCDHGHDAESALSRLRACGRSTTRSAQNPRNRSYVVGFGNNPPRNPHHRTAHGSWTDSIRIPTPSRHILYGALVGGPDVGERSVHRRSQQLRDERGRDRLQRAASPARWRASRSEFGGTPLANFPPAGGRGRQRDLHRGVDQRHGHATSPRSTSFLNNQSGWPARMTDRLSFRYYFTLDGRHARARSRSPPTTTSAMPPTGPTQHSGSIYYVTVSCAGVKIYPGGQQHYRKEVQFRIASSGAWDPTNDWSYAGVSTTPGSTPVLVNNIPVYDAGTRVFGNEPTTTASFTLGASPASVAVNRGASATTTINIARTGGFAGNVALTASGLPSGVTASFSPAATTGNSATLTLTASSTATLGSATVTVTGTSGSVVSSTAIALTVSAVTPSDFSLAATPSSLAIDRGASGSTSIAISRTGGFTGSIAFTASGLPSGVTASFNPASTTGTAATLILTASSTATLGAATVTITGTSGSLTHTATVALTVNAVTPADFSLSATPSSLSVARGASGAASVAIARTEDLPAAWH